jgi:hypothetical protein
MTLTTPYPATTGAASKACGGCRGCSGTSGGGCSGGCGGSGGAPARETAFVRPQFFGGMLLTEDDLQAVTDYVIGKRRLTNRYVFGPGVVCGLDVSCDPCDTGSVVVGPGYAIDCCGNDVVVDCPAQVDVIALVRELRQRSGVDCGEPCDDQPCHGYVLDLVYTEQPSDPVAPYAEDDCAVGDCEFSRVREGYRFELSCDAPEPEPSIIDVLEDCRSVDDDRVKEDAQVVARVVRLGMSRRETPEPQVAAQAEAPADIPLKREFDELDSDDAEFGPALDLVARATVALARDAAFRAGRGPSIGLNADRRKRISSRTRTLARRLLESTELAAMPEADRVGVVRLLNTADAQRDLDQLTERDRLLLAEKVDEGSAEEIYIRDAALMKSRVLRELADSGRAGCQEYRAVAALKFLALDDNAPREVYVLGRTFVSVLVRCVCDAANPRCPSCTDARIPLARLQVEGCDVVSVCDLERHWVNSPRALAYWFPVVEVLRELLEKRCCPDHCDDAVFDVRKSASRRRVVRERELDILSQQAGAALRLVRPPEDVPILREILEELGDVFVEPSPRGRRSVAAEEESRVAVLERQVAELGRRLEDLTGKQP